MKIALVHDYIKEYGGAERVLEALHELYPDAPVFTTVYIPEFLGPHRERFADWDIRTSWLQKLPLKQKLISFFRIISPFMFKSFDFFQYDIVIVSATGAYFPNTIQKLKAKSEKLKTETQNSKVGQRPETNDQIPIQICYCHTPPRYLYGYSTARDWKNNFFLRVIGAVMNHVLRVVDYNASKNVDYYIANSQEVAGRIKKFYRRDATIIYPPVDVNSKSEAGFQTVPGEARNPKQIRNYFLAGGRLARPKHTDLIIDACLKLNVPLKVFGKGFAGYGIELKSQIANRKSQIEFVGEVTDEEKWELMRNAKAFIFASEDEDFGITPVEAMAAGTPVIAYRSGGVKETVIEGKTGIFFNELTVESLKRAIEQFNNITIDSNDCIKQAEKFSKERFEREVKQFVEECINKK